MNHDPLNLSSSFSFSLLFNCSVGLGLRIRSHFLAEPRVDRRRRKHMKEEEDGREERFLFHLPYHVDASESTTTTFTAEPLQLGRIWRSIGWR